MKVKIKYKKAYKPKDEEAINLLLQLLIGGFNMLDNLGKLEKYAFFKFDLKRKLKTAERGIEKELCNNIDDMFNIDTDTMLKLCKNKATMLSELTKMSPEEFELINLVLKAVEGNEGNFKIIENFTKKLI